MWTAILAALNLAEGADHDVWSVNVEEVYLEEGAVVDELLDLDGEPLSHFVPSPAGGTPVADPA